MQATPGKPHLTLHQRLVEIAIVVFFATAACAAVTTWMLPASPRAVLIDPQLRQRISGAADMEQLRAAALVVFDESNRSIDAASGALAAAFDFTRYSLLVLAVFALVAGALAVWSLARMRGRPAP